MLSNSLNNFFILNNQTQKPNQEKQKFSQKLICINYSRYNVQYYTRNKTNKGQDKW